VSNVGRRRRLSALVENWWALAIRGLVALLFGLLLLLLPGLVLGLLTLIFGVYALVDGAISLIPALRTSNRGVRRWLPLAEGIVGVLAGLAALLWPGMTVSGLLYVITAWATATGLLKLLTALVLRREVENRWLLAGSGALSIIFGVVLAALARVDLPSLTALLGVFAVVAGLALIVFAFRLRERRRYREPSPGLTSPIPGIS
jgi:uncharacterized membrane protein HdeD (DUF308 family)